MKQPKTIPADNAVVADWNVVSALLARKHSTLYSPTSLLDFTHNEILVCDDTAATGSYNSSANAQRHAEKQLRITDPTLASKDVAHVTTIAATYTAADTH